MIFNYQLELPSWLEPLRKRLEQMHERGLFPQTLLIHGPVGCGRGLVAMRVAELHLGQDPVKLISLADALPGTSLGGHPDLLLVKPELKKDKTDGGKTKDSIGVDQIRAIRDFLELKSHRGGSRVIIVSPADLLTPEAANALLKTLEEPPSGSVIVLVIERLTRLPATVISRCQRVTVRKPARADAEKWLKAEGSEESTDWTLLLDFCGGAPMRALELRAAGFENQLASYRNDLRSLAAGRDTPGGISRRWAAEDPKVALDWLQRELACRLRECALLTGVSSLQISRKLPNMKQLLTVQRSVDNSRRNSNKAFSWELQLASVLHEWCQAVGRVDER